MICKEIMCSPLYPENDCIYTLSRIRCSHKTYLFPLIDLPSRSITRNTNKSGWWVQHLRSSAPELPTLYLRVKTFENSLGNSQPSFFNGMFSIYKKMYKLRKNVQSDCQSRKTISHIDMCKLNIEPKLIFWIFY